MKNGLFIAAAIIVIGIAGIWLASNGNAKSEKEGLPPSLDKYYNSTPPEYLISMFGLGESFMAIGVQLQQGDKTNATLALAAFSKNYEDSARMVPEWTKYYDKKVVEKLRVALDGGNASAINEAMGEVGAGCINCHIENMPPVWDRYNRRDFRTLKMNTPDGPLQWADAKMRYLAPGFDGIGVNINNGNQTGANQSFGLFKLMFENMNSTCISCHTTERRYYVSGDIKVMIDTMGEKISSGDLVGARRIQQEIGMESCYRCHVLHQPAQFAKETRK